MKRRDFLKTAIAATGLGFTGGMDLTPTIAPGTLVYKCGRQLRKSTNWPDHSTTTPDPLYFADPQFIGKHYVLEDATMYVRRV